MSHYDKKEKRSFAIYGLIFLLLIAGIVGGGYLSYRNFEEQFRAQAANQLSAIADLKVKDLVNWRKERLSDAELLHKNLVFASLVQTYFQDPQDDLAQAHIQNWLDNYRTYSEYDRVRLLDAEGQERLSSPGGLPPISSAVTDAMPDVIRSNQVRLVDFYRRDSDQQVRLSLLTPIMDVQAGNQLIGFVSITIDPQIYIYPYINEWPAESATAETLIVRRDGNDALFLNELRFDKNTALNRRSPLTATDLPAVKAVLGQTGVEEGIDYRGQAVLADTRAVPDSPWFLVTRMDTVEVYALLSARLWQTFLLVGMAVFMAGAGLVTVWRQQRILFYRRQAEAADALRESEALLHESQKVAGLGSYVLNFSIGTWTSSDVLDTIFGIDKTFERSITGWADLIHPADRQQMTDYFANEVIGKRTRFDKEYRIVRKDDAVERWVHGLGKLEFDAQDQPVRMLGTILDITERKRAGEALRESEDSLQLAILAGRMGIWNKNFVSGKLEWSLECKAMFGLPPEIEMNDELFMNALHPEDREPTNLAIRGALQKKTNFNTEYRVIWPDGSLHWIASQGHGYYDQNGQALRMDGLTFDITERKRAEQQLAEHAGHLEEVVNERTRELRAAQEKLVRQERLATLGQLAGSMGHELRNPLGVISNAIYFLKMAQPDASDQVKEYLTIIENEARTSDKIVTDLLDFTRIKSIEREAVSVSEMIRQTLNRFPAPASIEVTLNIPANLPLIFADPHHGIQILGNLTVNAYQSMDSNGGRIEISAASHNDMVSIAVHDNGAGISAENMKKIFEPLFTTKTKGIGLGLAVSQKLTEANGGRIEVESEAGVGSVFTVWLPVQ